MSPLVALVADLTVISGATYVGLRGKTLRERFTAGHAERAIDRSRRRVVALVNSGRRTRATGRALHNDFDYECRYWWGDRRPETNDDRNRAFGGDSASMDARRCLVCRPYDDTDEADLIGLPEIGATR